MLTFEYRDRQGTIHKFTQMNVAKSTIGAMNQALMALKSHAKAHYLTGPRPMKLGVVTGRLRSSLHTKVEQHGDEVIGKIGTDVWYGYTWEHGNPRVKFHPKRPFLRPAIDDKRDEIFQHLGKAVEAEING